MVIVMVILHRLTTMLHNILRDVRKFHIYVVITVWWILLGPVAILCHPIATTLMAAAATGTLRRPATICNTDGCNCAINYEKSVTVVCSNLNTQVMKIDGNSMPAELAELIMVDNDSGILILEVGSFSKLRSLRKIIVRNMKRLVIRRDAFLDFASIHHLLLLEVFDCDTIHIETHSFHRTRTPVSVIFSNIDQAVINTVAFSWIRNLKFSQIHHLQLQENVFSQQSVKFTQDGPPATKVVFENVTASEFPMNTFASSMSEIRLVNCRIGVIKANVFSGMNLHFLLMDNCDLDHIENSAFTDRTLIHNLEFRHLTIREIHSGAVQSAVHNFTIANSTIHWIHKEAFNMTAVVHANCSNNVFSRIDEGGMIWKNWNSMLLENNTFLKLNSNAISVILPSATFDEPSGASSPNNILLFIGNTVRQNDCRHCIALISAHPASKPEYLTVIVRTNAFVRTCGCDLHEWLTNAINADQAILDTFYNTSFCFMNAFLARCLQYWPPSLLPQQEAFVSISNFTESVCRRRPQLLCEEESTSTTTESSITTNVCASNSSVLSNNSILETAVRLFNDEVDEQQQLIVIVIHSLLIASMAAMLVMLIVSLIILCTNRRQGYLRKLTTMPLTSLLVGLFSRLFSSSTTKLAQATSVHSMVHEYAELQHAKNPNHQDGCNKFGDQQQQADVEMMQLIIYEDKATQTLPEELTYELLQSLREKLDDPNVENYSQARTIIEHLYDLIKVEESCNNNNASAAGAVSTFDDWITRNHLYQVITDDDDGDADDSSALSSPVRRTVLRPCKQSNGNQSSTDLVNASTRTPSLDKLSPLPSPSSSPLTLHSQNLIASLRPPIASLAAEYMVTADQVPYLYTEICSNDTDPNYIQHSGCSEADKNKSSYTGQLISGAAMLARPLPPKPVDLVVDVDKHKHDYLVSNLPN